MNPITSPIRLRAIEPEDLDALYEIENDTSLWKSGVTNVPYSRYLLHQYVATQAGDIYTDKQLRLMMENRQGDVVGIADLTSFDPRHARAEVGVVVKHAHRKQGYATAALKSLIDYARHSIHLKQIYAVIAMDNEASFRLFRKLDFIQGAILEKWLFDGEKYQDARVMQLFL